MTWSSQRDIFPCASGGSCSPSSSTDRGSGRLMTAPDTHTSDPQPTLAIVLHARSQQATSIPA